MERETREEAVLAFGPCVVCDRPFSFDPDRVGSVLVDPETGRPPDVNAAGKRVQPSAEAVARSVRQPYCPRCARALNDASQAAGRGRPFDETDTGRA